MLPAFDEVAGDDLQIVRNLGNQDHVGAAGDAAREKRVCGLVERSNREI